MSTRTTSKLGGLAAAMLVFLAVAPAANADHVPPSPLGAHNVPAVPTVNTAPVGPYPPAAHSVSQSQPVQTVTADASDSGFSWSAALVGAAVTFGLTVLAATGVAVARKRGARIVTI